MRHRVAFDRALARGRRRRADLFSVLRSIISCTVWTATGDILWTFFAEGPIRMAPTIWQDRVYFGAEDGVAYCLDAADGRLIWQLRAGRGRRASAGPRPDDLPLADPYRCDDRGRDRLFRSGRFPSRDVYLYAVDALTGRVVWKNDRISQQDAGRNPLSPQGYLLGNAQMLIVPSGRSLPAALDRQQGELIHQLNHAWRTTAGGEVGGWRAMLADGQIYSSGSHHFLAMNQKTGATGHAWITGHQLTMSGDRAFFATGDHIVAVDRPKHAKATVERQKYNLERYNLRRDRAKTIPRNLHAGMRRTGSKDPRTLRGRGTVECGQHLDSSLIVAGQLVDRRRRGTS
jgi:hypothetical protein